MIPSYLAAVKREISFYRERFTAVDTVYLGGGTPSVLTGLQIGELMVFIHETFSLAPGAEITIEINPADWGREDLSAAHGLGINRINIGVQSTDDRALTLLGRRHNAQAARAALKDARAAGFDNLGSDLIYNLPYQSLEAWEGTLEEVLDFHPEHLSCYELELKSATPLGRRFALGEFPLPTEEISRTFFLHTSAFLEARGYEHYEVSNFARGLQRASRHNQKYWDHTPYLGLGPAAHSYARSRRWWNHASLTDYIRDCDQGQRPLGGSEELSADQLRLEAFFLGLRTRRGIGLEEYRRRWGGDLLAEKGVELERLAQEGLLVIAQGRVCPTLSGLALADRLALL